MFNGVLKEHRAATGARRKQLEALRADALVSAEAVTHHLFAEVQAGVGLVYKNQRVLQNEASILAVHTQRFAKQSDRWIALSAQLNNALKELGDVHNWALTIQKDMRWIESNLEQVVDSNNVNKAAIKERREAELARRQAERAEADRRANEERARREAAKFAAAVPPQQQQQQQQQSQQAPQAAQQASIAEPEQEAEPDFDAVGEGDDEELP